MGISLPVHDAVSVSHLFSVSSCRLLEGLHLTLQPLSFSFVLLCLETPLWLPSRPLLSPVCTSVWGHQSFQYATKATDNNAISDHIKQTVGYLRSDGCSTGILSLVLCPCNLMSFWFSFLSSKISCWVWVIASHGSAGLGSLGGTEVTPGVNQEVGGVVRGIWTPLCVAAGWTLDVKWDGGTRSSWIFPK